MNIVFLKIRSWENARPAKCTQPLEKGDLVIVETSEGLESAIVEKTETGEKNGILPDFAGDSASTDGIRIVRKANLNDLKVIKEHRQKEANALKLCHEEVKKSDLPMKIVEASYSLDGGSISFAFIADGRVDFRELVKALSKKFQRSIRLHQIGARDEARTSGGYGICGRELCCIRFSENLPSISSEMAKAQQIVHRGSERISGLCGRLMCCLAFEADQYRELLEQMPEIGQVVKTKEGKGVVKKVNAILGTMLVELENGNLITVPGKEI
jgi:cell fate regulator YaaT (PSP1 superfamily)